MRSSFRQLVLGMGLLGAVVSGPALAQLEVEQTDGPSFSNIIRPKSAAAMYRFYAGQEIDKDGDVIGEPSLTQLRLMLGFSVFDDFMTSTLTFGAQHYSGTNRIVNRNTRLWNAVTAYSNDWFTGDVYADIHFPGNGADFAYDVGINPQLNAPFETITGTITLAGWVEADAIFSPKKQDANVKVGPDYASNPSYGLSATEIAAVDGQEYTDPGAKTDPDYSVDTEFLVLFTPAALPALTVGGGVEYVENWTATYEETGSSGRKLAYESDTGTTWTRARIKVDATDELSFTNDTFIGRDYYTGAGFTSRSALWNMTYLTYSFF